jgi:uncharacterized membrane protein YphA (DoxX/SURF4 family)
MRIPTFSRQSDTTTEDERPTVVSTGTSPVRTRTDAPPPPPPAPVRSTVAKPSTATTSEFAAPQVDDREAANRDANVDLAKVKKSDRPVVTDRPVVAEPVAVGPKPRASLLATVSLILSVAGALLVLSGPLTGYGVGVAGLALVLSLFGIHATRRRHVAGKTDAVLAMIISLAALVVGVLALTGSLSWAGTDVQPVTSLREWLDTQFANRF